jgi:RecA-family ATPase
MDFVMLQREDLNDTQRRLGDDAVLKRLDEAEPYVPQSAEPDPENRYADNGKDAAKKAAAMSNDRPKKPAFDWSKNSRTAAQLSKQEIPDVRWVIPRILPEGGALLAAKPKLGKSWLALDWSICIAGGMPLFDGTVETRPAAGDVLYLALEDNERRLKARIGKLCLQSPERLHLVSMSDGFPRAHEGGIDAIEDSLQRHKEAKLVVIDTFAKFRPPGNAKRGVYDQDYDSITPLLKLSHKYRIAILIIHHVNKGTAEDPFDRVSGTLGLTVAADTLMVLDRRATGVVLCMRGRDVEDEELALEFDKSKAKWRMLGNVAEVARSATDKAVLDALFDAFKEAPDDASANLTIRQIKDRIDLPVKEETLKRHVIRMCDRGLILRVGRGLYRHP